MFSSDALGYFALEVRHGWHLSTCSLTCAAMHGQKKWLCIRSSICSRPKWPTSSWHPLRAVFRCVAGRTSWSRASWDSLGRNFLYRMLSLSLRWLHSLQNCWSSEGSVILSRHWPRVPSHSLAITRSKTRSDCWACCQSSMVMLCYAIIGLTPIRLKHPLVNSQSQAVEARHAIPACIVQTSCPSMQSPNDRPGKPYKLSQHA